MIKQLQVISASKAREINPIERDEGFNHMKYDGHLEDWLKKVKNLELWQEAERSLKEYRIMGRYIDGVLMITDEFLDIPPVGTVHNFEVNQEEGTCIIL